MYWIGRGDAVSASTAVAPRECDVVSIGEKKGFALGADPDNPSEFADVARRMWRDPAALQAMGRAALAAASKYDRDQELAKLVRHLEESAAVF